MGQVGKDGSKAEKKEGDRDVKARVVMPADMAAHVGLFGCGGTRDKHFCSHCHCHTKELMIGVPTNPLNLFRPFHAPHLSKIPEKNVIKNIYFKNLQLIIYNL